MENYSVLNFLEFLGSLGVFLYGMKTMSEGVQKFAGSGLRTLINYFTRNQSTGFFSGLFITSLIQSSSATTVLMVSFVNAGLITVEQSIPIVIGANVGTTITSWLVTTIGFNVNLSMYVLPIFAITIPLLFSGVRKMKSAGEFFVGFCFLFLGLNFMRMYVPDFSENTDMLSFLAAFSDSGLFSILFFILVGIVLTIIVQSSSASLGITLVMVSNGWIVFEVAAAMVIGANIGTTLTALIASLVGNKAAKRTALFHLGFNMIGVVWVLLLYRPILNTINFIVQEISISGYSAFSDIPDERGLVMPLALTVFHTVFNLINGIILIQFVPYINKILLKIVPDNPAEQVGMIFGKNIIETPELAILEAKNGINKLGKLTQEAFLKVKSLFNETLDEEAQNEVYRNLYDNRVNVTNYVFEISRFLKDVSQSNLNEITSQKLVDMLNLLNEFEKTNQTTYRLALSIKKKYEVQAQLKIPLYKGIVEMFDMVEEAFGLMIANLQSEVEKVDRQTIELLEVSINDLRDKLRMKQMKRIEKQKDLIESSLLFRDLYSTLEKVADHLYAINELNMSSKY